MLFAAFATSAVTANSRLTAYRAVPGYEPVALGSGANVAQSSAWRGRWVDITGYYSDGTRVYDPVSEMWLSHDTIGSDLDPNGYSFCGGNPVGVSERSKPATS